jgi:hypothetical protein
MIGVLAMKKPLTQSDLRIAAEGCCREDHIVPD